MDAIKFLADCIRAEKKAEEEKAKVKSAATNPKPATVAETVGAVAPKAKESEQQPTEEPKAADDTDTQPEPEDQKGDDN